MSRYHHPAIKLLTDQQVRYAPVEARLKQVERAEKFLAELDREVVYLYPQVSEHVLGYKGEHYPNLELSGEELAHDLRLFIEDLSGSANINAESVGEPVLTVKDVSHRYNVSTKTVDRWRDQGLVSRRFKFGNRKRIGFLKSSVERFVSQFGDKVERGMNFSQLTDEEREEIIQRARRLARVGGCPTEISKRLAERLGRSQEAIRYTLKNYDIENPENAIFPSAHSALTEDEKVEIYRRFKQGDSVADLSRRYCRKRNSIYRILNEVRAERLLEQKIDYMDSPEFEERKADEIILGPPPTTDKKKSAVKVPPGLPPYLASLYSVPLLTREEEAHFFRKMNYLKFKANKLREELEVRHLDTGKMDQIEECLEQSQTVKNFLTRSNLRLVVSIAKKHVKPEVNFFEMISDGNMSLIRAIEKFDYTKGFKFSTYASWAIMKNYARSIPAEHTHRDRYRTGKEEMFSQSHDDGSNPFQQEMDHKKQRLAVLDILERLDEREKGILVSRYGLEKGSEPQTLEQVGREFGVTKERIRQLESRALQKLRKIATAEPIDVPGV
ncbi:RNA polymerase principal sigma factor HrdA [Polystyrenella longa]|uniref:RNA polymerase principal sigma factor HrdA n=1 Tax=Polystyrenella longa TaxID=2528007 RepID=A0A518CIU2_9PLAN|nr:sigma-70 family RNA polymerase sigma factor [Polystyrenella longa]QDU79152.1 RNA polymerase principal sigma factor HrdA [Polystyrenella longa]